MSSNAPAVLRLVEYNTTTCATCCEGRQGVITSGQAAAPARKKEKQQELVLEG